MGQKAHPKGLRLGIVQDWDSVWYADSNYKNFIMEDVRIRKYVNKEFSKAGISQIKIKRKSDCSYEYTLVDTFFFRLQRKISSYCNGR